MTKKMTAYAHARKLGYTFSRGDYVGTSDNRADRWYWSAPGSTTIDRRGPGCATRDDAALSALGEQP